MVGVPSSFHSFDSLDTSKLQNMWMAEMKYFSNLKCQVGYINICLIISLSRLTACTRITVEAKKSKYV